MKVWLTKLTFGFLKQLFVVFTVTGMFSIMIFFYNLSKPLRCPEHLSSPAYAAIDYVNWKNTGISQKIMEKPLEELAKFQASPSKGKSIERSCWPQRHIFFLKTHKTASSTIMNILFRFGESHNLTFALPSNNRTQFFYSNYFKTYFVEGFKTKIQPKYDIMCHHMRFDLTEVEKVMPKDTFYFTILRNPVSLMESTFSYYRFYDIFINALSLEDYLTNPYKYYKNKSSYSNFGKNLMAFDFGLNPDEPETPKHFELAQKTIETMFNLVLITEYFDESLILLKDALCWGFDDILSFPLNSRNTTSRNILSEETQEKIKAWNQLDWQLYIYFNRTFWEKVDKFGQNRMQSEVKELRRRRAEQSEICLEGLVDPKVVKDDSIKPFQAGEDKILGYNLKSGLQKDQELSCRQLITPELQYTALLYNMQNQKN
ncbi:galactose-3-O-sulfotransferase 2-like isoform X2 [Hyla sarda]|uniref:galactose-3-O-sulfotransferase 2-like isoform X2 n=1 Tax=Hyla sarda TaxID=327740 RepID=UPI0024C3DF9F|nr:galactose-3-O-sulfotransferase 2-like isoform X2 [Hyla sarda]